MSLVTTPGAADADSYASVAEYQAYWGARPQNETPLDFSEDEIETGLIMATRLLDAAFDWTGAAVDDVQALGWPRSGMATRNKFPIATTVVPQALKDATCQEAGDLLVSDRTSDNDPLKLGITSLKAGPVSLSFSDVMKGGDATTMDLMVRRLGPEFDWLSKAISDTARMLLPASWYTRASLKRPVVFEALR